MVILILLFGLAESRCGIRKPLEAAFGRETADNVLALARYAVSQGKSLSRAGDWLESHGMGALGLYAANRKTQVPFYMPRIMLVKNNSPFTVHHELFSN